MPESESRWDPFVLLMIDVQHDFWPDEVASAFPDFEANVRRLLEFCRRDGLDVVHLRAGFAADKSDWMARYALGGTIPCVDGTPGARVLTCAAEAPGERVISKQTFDGFLNPELPDYLEQHKKKFVLVAGLVTSVCVLLTAVHAAQRCCLVSVIEDCCADLPEAHRHTLERYPFVFDRCRMHEIGANRDRWLADLGRLADTI